jgi:hypothetical protein
VHPASTRRSDVDSVLVPSLACGDGTDAVIVELGANDALRGIDPKVTGGALDALLRRAPYPVLLCGMLAPRNLGADYGAAFDGGSLVCPPDHIRHSRQECRHFGGLERSGVRLCRRRAGLAGPQEFRAPSGKAEVDVQFLSVNARCR